jgi:hypothetical protein
VHLPADLTLLQKNWQVRLKDLFSSISIIQKQGCLTMKNPFFVVSLSALIIFATYAIIRNFDIPDIQLISYISLVASTLSNSYSFSKDKRTIVLRNNPIDLLPMFTYSLAVGLMGGRLLFEIYKMVNKIPYDHVSFWIDFLLLFTILSWFIFDVAFKERDDYIASQKNIKELNDDSEEA